MQLSLVQLHLHFRAIFIQRNLYRSQHTQLSFFSSAACALRQALYLASLFIIITPLGLHSLYLVIFLISSPKNMVTRGRVRVLSSSNLLSVLCEQHSLELLLPSCNENPHITCQQSELYCAGFTLPVTLNHPGHLSFLHLTFECNLKTLGINTPK